MQDVHSCGHGLKIRPEIGTVVLWYSLRPNGNSDPHLVVPVPIFKLTGSYLSMSVWVTACCIPQYLFGKRLSCQWFL